MFFCDEGKVIVNLKGLMMPKYSMFSVDESADSQSYKEVLSKPSPG